MDFKEFQIEFTYSGFYNQGLVQPFAEGSDMLYRLATMGRERPIPSTKICLPR